MPLSDYTRADKNEVVSQNLFLICLDIEIPSTVVGDELTTQHIYFVKDNQNLVWRDEIWYGIDFSIDAITDTNLGEVPRVDISISNTNRIVENYLHEYNLFTKTYGYYPITVKIMVVNTGNTVNGILEYDPEIEYQFDLKQPRTTDKVATFTLGAPSPYIRRLPLHRMFRNQGRVKKFGDWECGYIGAALIERPGANIVYTTTSLVRTGGRHVHISPVDATVLAANTVFNVENSDIQYHVADRNAYNNQNKYFARLSQQDFAVYEGAQVVNVLNIKHPLIVAGSQFSVQRTIPSVFPTTLSSHLEAPVSIGSTVATVHSSQSNAIPGVHASGTITVVTENELGGEGGMTPIGNIVSTIKSGDTLTVGGVEFLFQAAPVGGGGGGQDGQESDTPGPGAGDQIGDTPGSTGSGGMTGPLGSAPGGDTDTGGFGND